MKGWWGDGTLDDGVQTLGQTWEDGKQTWGKGADSGAARLGKMGCRLRIWDKRAGDL